MKQASTKSRLLLILLSIVLSVSGSYAQTDALFTQYYEVPSYYNPAAIGNSDYVRIRVGSRLQWLGIDGAPLTFLGLADMPVKVGTKRVGLGVVLQQESIGLYSNINASVQAGYKFKALKGVFTAAVNIGFVDRNFKGSEVYIPDDDDFHESTDDAIPTTDVHGTAFDIGAGIDYVHPRFHAGVSFMHANSPTVRFTSDSGSAGGGDAGAATGESAKNYEFQSPATLYFLAEGNIPIKNTLFEVMPSLMVVSDFTFTTGQITGRVRYNKFLTAGLGYRYNDAVSLVLAAEIKGFFIGYSYDYPVSKVSLASSGSHEVFAGYSLKLNLGEKNKNKHKSIRIM
ncbi:MAG: PorP/SprF family type IX secretion system membrane protein [Muribaculaceae bacterium]|nr:PorP/SprF family type IX secretion system membrane protein [Muribaculaceae bacterium]